MRAQASRYSCQAGSSMADSPPRSPDMSAAAVARSSAEPNSTRHSTSIPAPAASGSSPPRNSGTLPSAPAALT